jgi:6-phosphogluconolactonase
MIDNTPNKDSPHVDLTLLGLGNDGHAASLFAGTNTVRKARRMVTAGQSPTAVQTRSTMTLGVISQASVVLFLVTGANKAKIVKRVPEPETDADRQLPAALVKPETRHLVRLGDNAAAASLTAGQSLTCPRGRYDSCR